MDERHPLGSKGKLKKNVDEGIAVSCLGISGFCYRESVRFAVLYYRHTDASPGCRFFSFLHVVSFGHFAHAVIGVSSDVSSPTALYESYSSNYVIS